MKDDLIILYNFSASQPANSYMRKEIKAKNFSNSVASYNQGFATQKMM
jgi:hypothetical protein